MCLVMRVKGRQDPPKYLPLVRPSRHSVLPPLQEQGDRSVRAGTVAQFDLPAELDLRKRRVAKFDLRASAAAELGLRKRRGVENVVAGPEHFFSLPAERDAQAPDLSGGGAGLVFKAHRWLYHSTLGSRVIKKRRCRECLRSVCTALLGSVGVQGVGSRFGVRGIGSRPRAALLIVECWVLGVECGVC